MRLSNGREFNAKGFRGRPTTGFAREALLNILCNRLVFEGLRAVDLCAGTGAVGFELAIRGAMVDMVESDARHLTELKRNAAFLGLAPQLRIYRDRVERYLTRNLLPVDLVFADPPYESPLVTSLPALIAASGLLSEGGLLVVEHRCILSLPEAEEVRRYGDTAFSFISFPTKA